MHLLSGFTIGSWSTLDSEWAVRFLIHSISRSAVSLSDRGSDSIYCPSIVCHECIVVECGVYLNVVYESTVWSGCVHMVCIDERSSALLACSQVFSQWADLWHQTPTNSSRSIASPRDAGAVRWGMGHGWWVKRVYESERTKEMRALCGLTAFVVSAFLDSVG